MLDKEILSQLQGIFAPLGADIELRMSPGSDSAAAEQMKEFIDDVASTSPRISAGIAPATGSEAPSFALIVGGDPSGVRFTGIPNGHEFSSLLLAILNASGLGRNLPDDSLRARIAALKGPAELRTFVSLTCTNCPDVVQALNVITLLNPRVSNDTIDGGVAQAEVDRLGIQSVPTVVDADGKVISVGRSTLGELLSKLEERFGTDASATPAPAERTCDIIIAGGGPAGATAALYLARKGLKPAVIAGRVGGQVLDTSDIENIPSVALTTGTRLAADLREQMERNDIDIFDNRRIVRSSLKGKVKSVVTDSGEIFSAPQIIIATGASWRRLGVPGEEEHIGHGVAFCTHCDGPFYAGKRVAVIGGGNSGLEAAIDLAAICPHVDVFEFLDSLKADEVLQRKVREAANIDVHLFTEVLEIIGDAKSVSGLKVRNRADGTERTVNVEGVFVQIGLKPNSAPFAEELGTDRGQIITDCSGQTSQANVFAAGDVTNVPFKQIVIAMGEGAKAALAAFEARIRS